MNNKRYFKPLLLLVILSLSNILYGQKVDPNIRYQTLEGWGVSLSWWANLVGQYSQTEIVNICNDLTSPNELNMNIFRYNIHGGDNPNPHAGTTSDHFRTDSGIITSYKTSASGSYDWSANASQRRILMEILRRRPDAIFDAISYSPPYWMTISKCSAGGVNAQPNLPAGSEDDFADFLTDVVQYYHDNLDITFRTLTGLNEPSSGFWRAGGGQEGCGVFANQQVTLVQEIYKKLEEKGMLRYCQPGAPEESKINTSFASLNTYIDNELMSKIGQINTHSYSSIGHNRKGISRIAHTHETKLWQSETGPLGLGIPNSFENNLHVAAEQIIPDLKELNAHAWVEWQPASTSRNWGYYTLTVPGSTLTKHKNYYFRKQFSKYLKAGYTIIEIDEEKSVAAISPNNDELVIVKVNREKSNVSLSYDLSKFESVNTSAQIIRTSISEDTRELAPVPIANKTLVYSAPAESITTFVIGVTTNTDSDQLADGIYEIKAKHSSKYMSVKDASSANIANIEQNEYADEDHFKFRVAKFGADYLISPFFNDKVLSIEGASNSNRASLKQYQEYGDDSQRFVIEADESGYHRISNTRSKLYLSVADGSIENAADIVQSEDLETDNFLWEFIFIEQPLSTTSIESPLKVFPNPAQSSFQISGKSNEEIEVDILSLDGKVIRTINTKANDDIDISAIEDGVYLLRINDFKSIKMKKLIIKY